MEVKPLAAGDGSPVDRLLVLLVDGSGLDELCLHLLLAARLDFGVTDCREGEERRETGSASPKDWLRYSDSGPLQ